MVNSQDPELDDDRLRALLAVSEGDSTARQARANRAAMTEVAAADLSDLLLVRMWRALLALVGAEPAKARDERAKEAK